MATDEPKTEREPAKPDKKKGLDHMIAATGYSLSGVGMASHETAVRHEIVLGVIHFVAVLLLPLSFEARILLTLSWFVIVITELLNTAIEAVVDLASPDRHPLAKRAKDVASAAVFTAILCFGTCWGVTLLYLVVKRFFPGLLPLF